MLAAPAGWAPSALAGAAALAVASIRRRGVPLTIGAGLVTLAASLQAFGGEFYTTESIAIGIAIIAGIDRIMSEGRALTNVIGNSVATMVVAGWCGERDDQRFQAALDDPSLVRDAIEQEYHDRDDEQDATGSGSAGSGSADRTPATVGAGV